jgi:CheY-like chemotaxis protein
MIPLLPILLVENDPRLACALVELLGNHGLRVEARSHPFEAIGVLRNESFAHVVTDYRFGSNEDSEQTALALIEAAKSTPIGCITGFDLPRRIRNRYAFVVEKPFTIEQLITHIAPWAALQANDQNRADLIAAYFSCVSRRNWDAMVELCAPSIEYSPPAGTLWTKTIHGRAAFRRHTEEVFRSVPDAKFELREIFWLPRAAVARFRAMWKASCVEGNREGAVLFTFEGEAIAKVGIELHRDAAWARALRAVT